MATPRYSTFDRGYDEHTEHNLKRAPVLGRKIPTKGSSTVWRKYAAIAMVIIMAASAIVIAAPRTEMQPLAPADDVPAHVQAGEREVSYTMSHFGESYVKDSSLSAMGKHGSTPGVNEWWTPRMAIYGDTVMHNEFPYTIGYSPNAAANTYNKIYHAGYIMVSFNRFEMDAKNVPTLATGPGQDPKVIPVLGNVANDGGNVAFNWYMTYMTSADVSAVRGGTYFANSYYSVPALPTHFQGYYTNEGWYIEQHGTLGLDRLGAQKFLGLPGAGDLRTEFRSASVGNALNLSYAQHFLDEGDLNGIYNIYSCYDYPIDPVYYWLSLDPASTSENLLIRLWGYSWGMEALMMRFMDVTGLMGNFNVWPEDWYFNGTLSSTMGNVQSRMVTFDHLTNWKDYQEFTGAWMMEPVHADWCWDESLWTSQYNPYDAIDLEYRPGKEMWAPGSNYYGAKDTHNFLNTVQGVAYWVTPKAWDLVAGESITIKLSDRPFWAVKPFKGVAAEDFTPGSGSPAKVAEVMANGYWGEMVLGHGPDASLYSSSFYDSDTKTISYVGPMSFTDDDNSMTELYPGLEQTGSPLTILSVSRVSDYSMRIVEPGPYMPGTTYTLEVTAKDCGGATVTDWNGTADLSIVEGGAILGSSSLQFLLTDLGVKTTSIEFTTGSVVIRAEDRGFPLDVFGEIDVLTEIPEFPTLLIPVIGAVAVFVAFRRRKST